MSIDQGTSSTRSIVFDENAKIVGTSQKEHSQIYPQEAWVEHNPIEIRDAISFTMENAVKTSNIGWNEIKAIGITNQRETIVAWDKNTGIPLHNAIVWQCRRTAGIVDELISAGYKDTFHAKTGLILDAYFSGTKMKWLLENSDKVLEAKKNGSLAFGTIDSWIIYSLTGEHKTDDSNASRTLLYNIKTGNWDNDLLEILNIDISMLPQIHENASEIPFGLYSRETSSIPIRGVLGDQQAALFGQTAFEKGENKTTYGTGNFILLNTGNSITKSHNGLLSTVAWKFNGQICYALEGSVFVTGSAFQWLRDNLQLITSYEEIDQLAKETGNSGGVYFVPALVGLGAPHWDSYARGLIIGLTRGTTKSNIINATIDSIAFQTQEVIDLMALESAMKIDKIRVDGGITHSEYLLQRQSDISQIQVEKPENIETTALGAAMMAGLNLIWKDLTVLRNLNPTVNSYTPMLDSREIDNSKERWKEAVKRSKNWIPN
ncbi:MAG: glycerol kinase GlpK [Candidatus Kariarchaeaceae archaeon]